MLIDSHFHLTDEKYVSKEDVIERAKIAGVAKLITIGTNLKDNNEILTLIEKFPNLYGVLGVYPHEEKELKPNEIYEKLETLVLKSKKVVGIGECGIDIVEGHDTTSSDRQKSIFEMQINLAKKHNLPLVIHNRNGDSLILEMLKVVENLKGVIHCFTSDWTTAQKFLDLGLFISFSGIATYPSGKTIHETIEKIPLNRFLLETDAPWLSPQGYRDKMNEPAYITVTAQKVAEVKGIKLEQVEEYSYNNTCDLFGLPQN